MQVEHARAVVDAMVGLWQAEYPATLRVLGAVKDANRDYCPDSKSRTAWQIATHIATADLWFIDCIARGRFEWDDTAAQQAEARFGSVSDVVASYESTIPARLEALRTLSAEQAAEPLDFFGMMSMPRAQWIGFATHHSVHHRGQLSAYLRGMGSKVPDIYGPSGDAEPPVEASAG